MSVITNILLPQKPFHLYWLGI